MVRIATPVKSSIVESVLPLRNVIVSQEGDMIRPLRTLLAGLIVTAAAVGTTLAADTTTGGGGGNAANPRAAPRGNGCDYQTTDAGSRVYGGTGSGVKTSRHVGEGETVSNIRTGATWLCKNGKLVKVK